jgi:hypothetical protein
VRETGAFYVHTIGKFIVAINLCAPKGAVPARIGTSNPTLALIIKAAVNLCIFQQMHVAFLS